MGVPIHIFTVLNSLSNLPPPPLLVPCDQDDNFCTIDEVIMMCLAVLLLSWLRYTLRSERHAIHVGTMELR